MAKRILSIFAGVISGWLIVFVGDASTHILFPPPEGVSLTHKESIMAFMQKMPLGIMFLMFIFWLLASFIGGFVSGKINKTEWKRGSLITGVILLAATILNMVMIPHPAWMLIGSVILVIPSAYLGGKIAS